MAVLTDVRSSYERIWGRGQILEEAPEYYEHIVELIAPRPEDAILDIGCGAGAMLEQLGGKVKLLCGADISHAALSLAKRRVFAVSLQQVNAEHLPYGDNSFDCVLCLGSLEHFTDPVAALDEMRRVTNAAGCICVVLPNQWFVYDITRGWLEGRGLSHGQDFERFYGSSDALKFLGSSGWHVTTLTAYNPPADLMVRTRPLERFARAVPWLYGRLRRSLPLNMAYSFVFVLERYLSDVKPGEDAQDTHAISGWHTCELWPRPMRWTTRNSSLRLKQPPDCRYLHIKMLSGRPETSRDKPLSVTVSVDGIATLVSVEHPYLRDYVIPVPPSARPRIIEVMFEMEALWVPDEVIGNGDRRRLGMAVHRVWID